MHWLPMKRKRRINLPNYTQIPNVLLGKMSRMKVSEFYVLLFLCRETFGFHRKNAVLTMAVISRATGICRRGVINATHTLEGEGWIRRRQVGRTFSYSICLGRFGDSKVKEEESYYG